MKFGICTSSEKSAAVQAAGWDYVEEGVQGRLQGQLGDDQWTGGEIVGKSVLPVLAANGLVPATLKIVGPDVDAAALKAYMTNVLVRAGKVGIRTLVFGSGGARNVPDGFDRARARKQILDFLEMAAPIAQQNGVLLVAEPLNRGECNIINSVAEAMEYVRELNHPAFQCLVDSYHFWLEDEPLENLRAAMPWIKHVHLADKVGRVAPGLSGQSDYKPFFRVLKAGGYDGLVSYEGKGMDPFAEVAPKVLAYVKREWSAA
jgi:sugar phosphate isomerase/epimerase